jgi:tetratricopeptide (TPR) repeat protein
VNNRIKLLLLVLLVKPVPGFGQQQPASRFESIAAFESLVAAAQKAQAVHDFVAAVNDYKQAVNIRADMPELWANLGLAQQQGADIPGAILSFQQANHINPSLYVPNLFLGIDYLREGRAAQAIPFLIRAEKINKSDPQPPLALGRAYLSAGKFAAAAQELDRATTLDPKLGYAWFTLGIARLDQVEADGFKMSEVGQDSPFAKALYAESLQKQARFGEAAALYKSLMNSNPQPPCIHSELGFSLLREHDLPGAASEFAAERAAHPGCSLALLGQARMALDSGDNEQAVKVLKDLWDRDHGFVVSNAGILLEGMSSEQISAAGNLLFVQDSTLLRADLRAALLTAFNLSGQGLAEPIAGRKSDTAPAPEQAFSSRRTAEQLYAAGQFQQCSRRLESDHAALNADELRLLAACSLFTGDNQRASNAASALEALQPHSLEALYWSIQANERLALKSLARFQQMEPDSARSHVLLGDMYHQLERNDDAQAEYLKALALAPDDPAAMLGLAWAYFSNNNIAGSMETARRALVRSPEDPELNLVMAQGLMSHKEFAAAEPYLEKSLHAKPQMLPRVHALIGQVYAETGRTQPAVEQLKMGASSDEDGTLQYLLARLYHQLGDEKDASAALQRMKEIKRQRSARGVKAIEDPDLSALEATPSEPPKP